MDVIRENRLLASILGGLVVMSLLVFLLNGGDSSGPSVPASESSDPTADLTPTTQGVLDRLFAPRAAADEAFARPNVRTLECGTLLPNDATREALGGPKSWGQTALAEDCFIQSNESSATLQIAPGSPDDFSPGAQIFGVTGVPVTGVGDLALWFGGPDAEGGGTTGALVVAAESELGALVFRIAVGRPDLDGDAQLEIAKTLALAALPRFPGVAAAAEPEPEPVEVPVITIEHDPVERSNESYVENLLAREADGEWTRGEGLVATLRLFAGELDADEVLRGDAVVGQTGTGIVRLATAYLDTGGADGEAAIVTEIERLFAALFPPPPPDADDAATRTPRGNTTSPISFRASQTPDCYVPFATYEEVCFLKSPFDQALFGDKYTLWAPDLPNQVVWAGWVIGDTTIPEAIVKSAIMLERLTGDMPVVETWLTPNKATGLSYRPGYCRIYFGSELQDFSKAGVALAKQVIAAEISRCYIFENLATGNIREAEWWEDGIAFYLSDVVYPNASWELYRGWPAELTKWEFSLSLPERTLINMPFFEYLDTRLGLQGTVDVAKQISSSGLESVPAIDDYWHEYVKSLTAGIIFDQSGVHAYEPRSARYELAEATTILAQPPAFGQERIHLTVANGMHACLEYEDEGNLDMLVSWRPGAPRIGEDWSMDLPASLSDEAVFVITNTQPDSRFYVNVTEVRDDDKCGEEEEPDEVPIPEPPCGDCPGTSFYSNWKIPGLN